MYSNSVRSTTNLKAVWQCVISVRTCSAPSPVNRPCSLQIKSPPDSCISTRSTMRPLNKNLHVTCQRSYCELVDPARGSGWGAGEDRGHRQHEGRSQQSMREGAD